MVIPTGAMGNLTGGYMAKQMGVPIGMLCAGVNINGKMCGSARRCTDPTYLTLPNVLSADITHRVMERGEFHRRKIKQPFRMQSILKCRTTSKG